jgi:hypothetical protein
MSHSKVPTLIELRCPKCGGVLLCVHPAYAAKRNCTISGVMGQTEKDKSFQATCQHCMFRREHLSYFDLPGVGELYLQGVIGTTQFWAWNIDHLRMIIGYLEARVDTVIQVNSHEVRD